MKRSVEELFSKESLEHGRAGIQLIKAIFDGVGDVKELSKGFEDWEVIELIVRGVEVRPSRTADLLELCCAIPNYEGYVLKLISEKTPFEQLSFIKKCLENSKNEDVRSSADSIGDIIRKRSKGVLAMDWSEWQELVRLDNIDEVTKVIEKGDISIDTVINPVINLSCDFLRDNPTLAEFAAFWGAARCFKFLMEKGAVVRRADNKGRTIAQFAVAGGNREIVDFCKEKRFDFKDSVKTAVRFHRNDLILSGVLDDSDSAEVLYECALSDNPEMLLYFLEKGMNINKTVPSGYAPIHAATYARAINVLKLLVNLNVTNVNIQNETYGFTALHMAALNGFDDCARIILQNPNCNQRISDKKGRLALHIAAQHGYPNVIEVLLEHGGVTVNSRTDYGATALHVAVLANQVETVKYLLARKDMDVEAVTLADETALHCAARSRSEECAALILERGIKSVNTRDRDGWTPLHYASRCIEVFQMLLGHKSVDVNSQSNSGTSPLHLVVAANDVERIAALFQCSGLNVNVKDKDGWCPIHIAAKSGSLQAVQALSGMDDIDINAQTKAGWTALHLAIQYNHIDIAMFLLSIPVISLKPRTVEGWSALHIAGMARCWPVFEELVARGLDRTEKDKEGRTPDDLSKLPAFAGDGEELPWGNEADIAAYVAAEHPEEDELETIPELRTD